MSKVSKSERDEALERLHKWIKPGDTVYTILRHVSRSGMQRRIGVVLLQRDGENTITLHPNHAVATATGLRFDTRGSHDGVVMGGCGMDMGFALVYELSAALYPEGFGCIGEGCPSNDHSNGDRDYEAHSGPIELGHWHKDGGYALRQRWL